MKMIKWLIDAFLEGFEGDIYDDSIILEDNSGD